MSRNKKNRNKHKQKFISKGDSGLSTGHSYAGIDVHTLKNKVLHPPITQIGELELTSWMNNRIPELLWATLLISQVERAKVISLFRDIGCWLSNFADYSDDTPPIPCDFTHSTLNEHSAEILDGFFRLIAADSSFIAALKPLNLLEGFPLKEKWQEIIGEESHPSDWDILKTAVGKVLNHQSEESADCRWLRSFCHLQGGAVKFYKATEEMAKTIYYYPAYGDERLIAPRVRNTEGMLDSLEKFDWHNKFWHQCLIKTQCDFPRIGSSIDSSLITTMDRLDIVSNAVSNHFYRTLDSTGVNIKHDTVFGFVLYSVSILKELLPFGRSNLIIARMALRTLLEGFITLSYLCKKDEITLWQAYRNYGQGQAKLAFLKLSSLETPPSFVSLETLEGLANEDLYQEYIPIDLGHWNKTSLRDMSVEVGLKDEYDRFYSWTSSFSHGHWSSVREAVFTTCLNPLHRLHRIPNTPPKSLDGVMTDACYLVDRTLEVLGETYPYFDLRVSMTKEEFDSLIFAP